MQAGMARQVQRERGGNHSTLPPRGSEATQVESFIQFSILPSARSVRLGHWPHDNFDYTVIEVTLAWSARLVRLSGQRPGARAPRWKRR